eukprot:8001240-Prorocentrum_lima.AAC.1
MSTGFDPPFVRGRYETLDYILCPHRWRNIFLDVQADFRANLATDHRPLMGKLRVKLKAQQPKKGGGVPISRYTYNISFASIQDCNSRKRTA